MADLAINGGSPIRTEPFRGHYFIGEEEKEAVMKVLDSGNLSQFIGCWHEDFYGGPAVRQMEQEWAEFTGAKIAIGVNSNTSGLMAAIGAAGVGPGDEVIVSPYTMSASATSIIAYGGVPVFADIEPETYGLDPEAVRAAITPRTKAIMTVHIFGHPCRMDELRAIATEHDLILIEDAAQAPGAVYRGEKVGALGDLTIFSLNYHKHIHCGEGGIVTTNNEELGEKVQLIRNHGESVVGDKGTADLVNSFGFNYRPTEVSAAIAIEQLRKLPALLAQRIENAEFLNEKLADIPHLDTPVTVEGCKHAYYVQPFLWDEDASGVSRDRFVEAIAAELPLPEDRPWPLIGAGYVAPLYLLPMYQQQIAMGPSGFPFHGPHYEGSVDYRPGLCPVVEDINRRLMCTEFMRPPCDLNDMRDVGDAFTKVSEHLDELRTPDQALP